MSRRARVWAAIAAILMSGTGERMAHAYVRFLSAQGAPLFWSTSCIRLTVYPDDLSDLTPDQTMHAAQAAAAAWSRVDNTCTYLTIDVQRAIGPGAAAAYDGRNVVVFRKSSWCPTSSQTGACTGSYDPALLALTSLFTRTSGEIVDADIQINAVNFAWTDLDINPTLVADQDLQNELTRQLGHVLGLARPCYLTGSVTLDASGHPLDPSGHPLVDNLGQPIPDCSAAPQGVLESSMFPSNTAGDTSRRTLAADDVQGLCSLFPVDADPNFCPSADADGGADGSSSDASADAGHPVPSGGCGCDVGADTPRAQWFGIMFALLALAGRRRRRFAGIQGGRRWFAIRIM